MSLTQTPPVLYESIKRTLAVASGPPRRRFPLPQNSPIQFAAYAFDQELEMLLANFPPAPKNTPSNAAGSVFAGLLDGNAILTKLSQPSPTGGGKGKFTGSFAVVPASWDDFQSQLVNYPGWINLFSSSFRDALPLEVTVRLHYDYFVVDPTAVLTGAGVKDSGGTTPIVTVTSKGSIPILFANRWLATNAGVIVPNDFAKALVPAGGVSGYQQTVPSVGQYQSWCAVSAAFIAGAVAWDSSHPPAWNGASTTDVLSGQFQFADSKLVDYEGNIVARVTPFALAQ